MADQKLTRRTFLKSTLAGTAIVVSPTIVRAQSFPSRPIRLICPWTAGGTTDVVVRAIAESASKALGGSIIVENKPGAGGIFGAVELANAKPDGYTLAQLPISVFRIPHTQKVTFDPLRDITYVACLTGYTFGMVVQSESPIRDFAGLISYAKENPEKFTYGTPGTTTTPHLIVELFSRKAGVKLTHIPFKGVAEGMQALIGGHVMGHSDSTGWGPFVDQGRARLLATYGSKRTKRWPNVPTLQELGYQTMSDSPFGIGAPKGMDPALTRRLQDVFKKTLEDPAVLSTLEKFDQPVIYMDSEGYTKFAQETFKAEREAINMLGMLRVS
jgi:tripartite-type tricarboxylate transporter receptor subunit TctC